MCDVAHGEGAGDGASGACKGGTLEGCAAAAAADSAMAGKGGEARRGAGCAIRGFASRSGVGAGRGRPCEGEKCRTTSTRAAERTVCATSLLALLAIRLAFSRGNCGGVSAACVHLPAARSTQVEATK